MQAAHVPNSIAVEQPFTVKLRVSSHVERRVGGLLVMVNQGILSKPAFIITTGRCCRSSEIKVLHGDEI